MKAPRQRWTTLDERRASLISALMIATGPLSLTLYTPALPTMVAAFSTTPAAVKFSLTIYFLGFCLAQLLCGPLSDAYGRRPVALVFFVVYCIGGFVAMLAPNIGVLQAGRALQGIGAAVGVSTSRAVVRDLFVGQASARIMNQIGLLVGLVPALSPALGSLLLAAGDWHLIFIIMFVYGMVLLMICTVFLPETNKTIDPDFIRPRQIVRNYWTLLSDRRFMAPAVMMGMVMGGLYTLPSLLPFVLIDRLGLSPVHFALVMVLQTSAMVVGNLVTGALLRRMSARRIAPAGIFIVLLSGAGFGAIHLVGEPHVIHFALPSALWVFGLPFISPGAFTSALSHFPKIAGAASALIGFIQMGGGFLGSAIGAAAFGDPVIAIDTLMPVIALLAGISYFFLPDQNSPPEEAE